MLPMRQFYEIFELLAEGVRDIPEREKSAQLRKSALAQFAAGQGFTKVAFDTRRIDQETEYNPRRGLQNYNRSQAFLSQTMADKLNNFTKLQRALVELQGEHGKSHQWQDSNARVLLSTLDAGLRTIQKDGDYSDTQPALGSFDYIEELLHVRYRLTFDSLQKMGIQELKRVILSKDEELLHKEADLGNNAFRITRGDVGSQTYDTLMEKLFGNVRASAENPEVERTVTITIKDRFHKEGA